MAESVNVGDTLSDGSQVQDPQVAAAMNKRLKQHPELRQAFFGQRAQQEPAAQGEQPTAEPTPEEWAEAKKKYAKFYGNDVQNAVRDRFKNQADANEKLKSMDPMIQALMKKKVVNTTLDGCSEGSFPLGTSIAMLAKKMTETIATAF